MTLRARTVHEACVTTPAAYNLSYATIMSILDIRVIRSDCAHIPAPTYLPLYATRPAVAATSTV